METWLVTFSILFIAGLFVIGMGFAFVIKSLNEGFALVIEIMYELKKP